MSRRANCSNSSRNNTKSISQNTGEFNDDSPSHTYLHRVRVGGRLIRVNDSVEIIFRLYDTRYIYIPGVITCIYRDILGRTYVLVSVIEYGEEKLFRVFPRQLRIPPATE